MDLREISVFCEVCAQGSVTGAANMLHMSQPAVSYILKKIENEYNLSLFVRKSHGLELTVEGELFLLIAKKFLDTIHNTDRKLHDIAKRSTQLRLACNRITYRIILPQWLSSVKKEFPDLKVLIKEMDTKTIIESLIDGKIDCAIFPKSGSIRYDGLDNIPLEYDEHKLLVSKDHPLASKERITIDDIRDESFAIMNYKYESHSLVYDIFKQYGCVPHVELEADSFETIAEAVVKNNNVTFLFGRFIDYLNEVNGNKFVGIPYAGASLSMPICFWWARDNYILTSLRDLINYQIKLLI